MASHHANIEDMTPDYTVRLIIVGDSGCGKTSLLLRYVDDKFSPSFISTVGIDFRLKTIQVGSSIVKVQIFDTAGQERFKTITKAYYRNADGALLIYDISNDATFKHISEWVQDMEPYIQDSVKYLIGNKSDLEPIRAVTRQQGEKLAKDIGYKFMESSALSGSNVNEVFQNILTEVLKNMNILKRSRELSSASSSSPSSPSSPSRPSTVTIQSAEAYNKNAEAAQTGGGGRCGC